MKKVLGVLTTVAVMLFTPSFAQARGGGGGYHGGGGGYHGGGEAGGYHGGEAGGYHGGEASGYHGGGFDTGGYHASGAEASGFHASDASVSGFHASDGSVNAFHASTGEVSGYHAGGYDAGGYHAAGAAGYGAARGLPTDGAFGGAYAGEAARAGAFAHPTMAVSGSVAAARGAAVRNSFVYQGSFDRGWFGDHPGAWVAAGWDANTIWRAAAWSSIGPWCGWGEVAPIEYEYGNNITYVNDQVYYGDQDVATSDQYYQQAAAIAQSVQGPDRTNSEWLPLGVFSLVQGDQSDSNSLFQLAVNKSGAIAGNYTNAMTGTTAPVHGAVDKKNQRAAWTVGENKTTIYDVGMSSLTKDEAPILIHIGKDKTQQWLLVRIKQPDQPAAGQ